MDDSGRLAEELDQVGKLSGIDVTASQLHSPHPSSDNRESDTIGWRGRGHDLRQRRPRLLMTAADLRKPPHDTELGIGVSIRDEQGEDRGARLLDHTDHGPIDPWIGRTGGDDLGEDRSPLPSSQSTPSRSSARTKSGYSTKRR